MDGSDRKPADTRLELHVQNRAIDIESVRVRSVKNDDLFTVTGAGLHQMMHGNIIGIVPQAHILNVNNQDIELVCLVLARNPRPSTIKGNDLHSGLLVHTAADMLSCIGIAPKSMFRRENSPDIHAFLDQGVNYVLTVLDFAAGNRRFKKRNSGNLIECALIDSRFDRLSDRLVRLSSHSDRMFPAIISKSVSQLGAGNLVSDYPCLVAEHRHTLPFQQRQVLLETFVSKDNFLRGSISSTQCRNK